MAQITCKELSALSDLLTMEENMVAKCRFYASQTNDNAIKNQCEQLASRHQRHFDELYSHIR